MAKTIGFIKVVSLLANLCFLAPLKKNWVTNFLDELADGRYKH